MQEEIKERKRKQHKEAQRRYYQKHKEYYKDKATIESKKVRNDKKIYKQALLDIKKYVDRTYDVMDYRDYPPYLEEIEDILNKVLGDEKE